MRNINALMSKNITAKETLQPEYKIYEKKVRFMRLLFNKTLNKTKKQITRLMSDVRADKREELHLNVSLAANKPFMFPFFPQAAVNSVMTFNYDRCLLQSKLTFECH